MSFVCLFIFSLLILCLLFMHFSLVNWLDTRLRNVLDWYRCVCVHVSVSLCVFYAKNETNFFHAVCVSDGMYVVNLDNVCVCLWIEHLQCKVKFHCLFCSSFFRNFDCFFRCYCIDNCISRTISETNRREKKGENGFMWSKRIH